MLYCDHSSCYFYPNWTWARTHATHKMPEGTRTADWHVTDIQTFCVLFVLFLKRQNPIKSNTSVVMSNVFVWVRVLNLLLLWLLEHELKGRTFWTLNFAQSRPFTMNCSNYSSAKHTHGCLYLENAVVLKQKQFPLSVFFMSIFFMLSFCFCVVWW